MGRPNQKDRGLATRRLANGKRFWRVRLWHEGREVSFQPFWLKREAKAFYLRCKLMQKSGDFDPNQFQKGPKKNVRKKEASDDRS